MNSLAPIYNLPTDDLTATVVPTVPTGTPDATYGDVTNLSDGQPGHPFKFTTTFGSFLYDFGSPVLPALAILRHTNLLAGTATAVWQGSPDNATWDTAIPYTLTPFDEDGFSDDPPILLSSVAPGQVARRYWREVFAGNNVPITIGGHYLSVIVRQFPHGPSKGFTRDPTGAQLSSETDVGVVATYDLGARWDTFSATIITSRSVGLAALTSLHRSARRRVRAWPIIIDPLVNRAQFVRFDQDDLPTKGLAREAVSVTIKLREVSKGQAWVVTP